MVKGHFGTCLDRKDGKVYDGATSGSACCLWRIRSDLYGVPESFLAQPEPMVKVIHLKPVSRRPLECIRCGSGKIVFAGWRKNKVKLLHRVMCQSCGKRWSMANPFPKSQAPKEVDGYIIKLARQGLSACQIHRAVLLAFRHTIVRTSVWRKIRIYAPDVILPKGRPHNEEWRRKIRESVIKHNAKVKGIGHIPS